MPGSSSSPSASASNVSMPMPGFVSPSTSVSTMSMPVPGLAAHLSASGVSVPVFSLLAPPFLSGMLVHMPGLSSPLFSIWSSLQTPTPILGRQKLGKWSGIIKRASLEKASSTFTPLFPSSECLSPFLFPSNSIGKNRPFNKVFNINCRPLANDHVGEDVNLSFAECQCPPAVKANRPWWRELLD